MDSVLSRIETAWTEVLQANQGPSDACREARRKLLDRYALAVERYLRRAIPDPHEARAAAQEFALRFLKGGFRNASPDRGKFRAYLKRVLINLANNYHRERARRGLPLGDHEPIGPDGSPSEAHDRQFVAIWRATLLHRSWEAMERRDLKSGRFEATLLRLRTDHLKIRSDALAEEFSRQTGKRVGSDWVDRHLHEARKAFARLFVNEVARTLAIPSPEMIEEELADLGMLETCREELNARRNRAGGG